jgi:glycosyltransferase involved in cell wall biosynthesis
MRILLSAYSCEPHRGSEPGVGWNWALELQRQGHDVVVLTRTNNRPQIEEFFAQAPAVPRPEFTYYDLPAPFLYLKRKRVLPILLYYFLWQVFCVPVAKAAAGRRPFDFAWHITFATIRWPSFLWRLGIPLVFGPAGGGERAPMRLRNSAVRHQIRELFRDLIFFSARIDPFCRLLFRHALVIFATTPESADCVPAKYRQKVRCRLSIGVDGGGASDAKRPSNPGKFLYVGNLLQLKGVDLAIQGFAEFVRRGGVARFTLVGQGPEEARLRALAATLKVDHLLDWISWIDHREIHKVYQSHDIFVFPSLHDSGGLVVIEAMSHGLPVVCLDLGGPGQSASAGGIVLATAGLSKRQVVENIGGELKALSENPSEFERISAAAIVRARDFLWHARVSGALREVQAALPLYHAHSGAQTGL